MAWISNYCPISRINCIINFPNLSAGCKSASKLIQFNSISRFIKTHKLNILYSIVFQEFFHLNFVPGLCWRLTLQPRSLIYFTLGSYSRLWNLETFPFSNILKKLFTFSHHILTSALSCGQTFMILISSAWLFIPGWETLFVEENLCPISTI